MTAFTGGQGEGELGKFRVGASGKPVVAMSNDDGSNIGTGPATMPSATTMQTAATANVNGTVLNVQGYVTAIINISSSPSMSGGTTVNFEISTDGTEWTSILAHQIGSQGNQSTTTSSDGDYRINCAGFKSLRARISNYSAGTVTIKGYASPTAGHTTTVGVSGVSASSTGGYTPGKLISAASTNGTNIKGSAGTIGYMTASNINASPRYLKIYDKATTPTVGTDTPIHTFLIPGNTAGAGTNIPVPPQGILCSSGIGIGITTGAADNDTGAVAASDIIVNYGTK